MASNYAQHVSARKTPQSEPIPGSKQVVNSAGGFSFPVDSWTRLERFLILGNEGGSYYAGERELTRKNAGAVLNCAAIDPRRTVDTIVEISRSGRAPKNDPAIFALALLSGRWAGVEDAAPLALDAVSSVCRTGSHLFQFIEAAKEFRGWGRGLRRAVARWYTETEPTALAYQLTKYRGRLGWDHHDVLHKCHAKPPTRAHKHLFEYTKNGRLHLDECMRIPAAMAALKRGMGIQRSAKLIREHELVRECVPTELLGHAAIWDALLANMPMTAMLRNLGKMSAVGLLEPMSEAAELVYDRLIDQERLSKARIHPFSVLLALTTYTAGHGVRGKLNWMPIPRIVDALEAAFYASFQFLEPTHKGWLLGIDISGSMACSHVAGSHITANVAAACMAMVTMRTEGRYYTHGFSDRFVNLGLSSILSLEEVVQRLRSKSFGGTDCALPMIYAAKHHIPVDVFAIYTDSETWYGDIHPVQALHKYRKEMGIPAKLIVIGLVSNGFSIADPDDAGMLDVVGFDAAAPSIMADFARGVEQSGSSQGP